MVQLVCRTVVIESRHCHCDDGEDPVQTNMPQERRVALAGESPDLTPSEGGPR
jgi:hypothetical protein